MVELSHWTVSSRDVLSVLVLREVIIAIEIFRHNHGTDVLELVAIMVMASLLGLNLVRGLLGHIGS